MQKSLVSRMGNMGVAVLFFISGVLAPLLASWPVSAAVAPLPFTETTIEANEPSWGKQFADLDRDGLVDIVEGGPYVGGIFWYKAPTWQKFEIGDHCSNTDDLQVADMNGDNALDVIATDGICWYENPLGTGGNIEAPWGQLQQDGQVKPHGIDSTVHSHDLQVGPVTTDGSGRMVVARGTGELGPTYLYVRGATEDNWTKISFPTVPIGQGTAPLEIKDPYAPLSNEETTYSDINRDGRIDIVGNGYWLEQPTDPVTGTWVQHTFTAWTQGASVSIADMNKDGRVDVFIAPSEAGAGTIAWFENPADPNGTWTRHDIGAAEDVHRFHVFDMNKDGRDDVVFAEMHQTSARRVGIFFNEGGGTAWTLQTISAQGSHNISVGDVGGSDGKGDGDLDILGSNWNDTAPDGGALKLWQNGLNPNVTPSFNYIQVDNTRTQEDFGLTYGDMDNDNRKDIISGQFWYKNPGGDLTGAWTRTDLGAGKDAMLTLDVDNNGQRDIIAQQYTGGTVQVLWLKPTNPAATAFTATTIGTLPDSPDHKSQGYTLAQIVGGGKEELVFSTDAGYFYFTVPADPTTGNWPRVQISTEGRQEGLAVRDINNDGKLDLIGSTDYSPSTVAWWQNPGTGAGNWAKNTIANLPQETTQVRSADVNNDGRMDVIATDDDLAAQVGHVYWFERMTDGSWTSHTIATMGSLESLDIGDFTGDGKIDIVTGDHKRASGPLETVIFANGGSGASWTKHVIDTGKESHLGTQVTDLDNDGDLDFASIAWTTNNLLHLWRNNAVVGDGGGAPDTTAPTISNISTIGVTGASATVIWETNEPADTKVEYGTTAAYGSDMSNPTMVTAHNQKIGNLAPLTTYHYRVISKDAAGNTTVSGDQTFTTLEAAAVAHMQNAAITSDGGGESIAQTFTTQNTAGNLIVAAASWGRDGTMTCSDTRGNTYTTITSHYDSAQNQSLAICYAADIAAGPNTVTAHFGGQGAGWRRLIIHEYSGIAAVNPVDVTAKNNVVGTTAANAITSTAAPTTANGDLIFGATMDDYGTANITAGTGFTQRNSVNNKDLVTQDKIQETAGPVASTMTFSKADRYMAQMVAFKAANITPPAPDTTAPVLSNIASSNVTTTAATIGWTTNEAASTKVEYGTTTAYGSDTSDPALVTNHTATLSGLQPNTTYHYRVISKDAAENVATSGDFTFTTQALPPPDTTAPIISGVAHSGVTTTAATIAWTTDEPSDTQVEYGATTAYGATTTLVNTPVTAHSQGLSGLQPNTTYHYRVLSKDGMGNLATSSDFTFTTQALPPPDTTPPTITSVTSTNVTQTGATITWTTNEAADTKVEYGTTTAYGLNTSNPTMVTAHSAALTGLTANTTYHYRVISKDAFDNTATSADFTFTTPAAPPVSPIAHLQTANYTNNSGSKTAIKAFSGATTAGNFIVAAVSWGDDGTFTCTDNKNNTYAVATIAYDSQQSQSLGVCYARVTTGGSNTQVTVTFAKSSAYRRLIIHEYSGIAAVNPVDVTAKNNTNGTTGANAITSGLAATTVNGDLIFGATMDDAWVTSVTAGTGFTQRNSVNNKDLVTQDMVQATAGPVASTMTFGAGHRYLAHMVAFKAAQ